MTMESEFIASLRTLATDPAARGLLDDAAVLEIGGTKLVLTQDTIIEGLHFLAGDAPGDVAWKLLAVNLSDLAAKGARPAWALLSYSLGGEGWNRAFVEALGTALSGFGMSLLGGDTVAMPAGAPRSFTLTAIGTADGPVPSRARARPGDIVWVTGTIGDAGLGLEIARGSRPGPDALAARYRRPRPRLEAGQRLAPMVSAMMDVSDGLLVDARRMAEASGCAIVVELDDVPLSEQFLAVAGDDVEARLFAATAGDDYELLFAAPEHAAVQILSLSEDLGLAFSRIGRAQQGSGLKLVSNGGEHPLPDRLGFEHRFTQD